MKLIPIHILILKDITDKSGLTCISMNSILNGFKNDETTTVTINECWNQCETNSFIKCAAISFNNYYRTCYLYDTEFFEKHNFDKKSEFTTLMRKSKFHI